MNGVGGAEGFGGSSTCERQGEEEGEAGEALAGTRHSSGSPAGTPEQTADGPWVAGRVLDCLLAPSLARVTLGGAGA